MAPDDWPWGKTCRVPAGLSRERLERWCDLKTRHDARLAAARGRSMSAKQFVRRLSRRRALAGLEDGMEGEASTIPMIKTFDHIFKKLTRHQTPHEWQQQLGSDAQCRSRVIRIPTGLGKTEGVMAAWLWHRLIRDGSDATWPRRLVWCLPMRVLVEQTAHVAKQVIERLGGDIPTPVVVPVMGGVDAGEWFLEPEQPAVLIGTQDMLLSRALNRGYGSGRARWPAEYGLLHQDALWVMDEIQLMDVGLATSAQLQAYRDHDQAKGLCPCHTWWMSATLQDKWLKTVDTGDRHAEWTREPITIAPNDRKGGLWDISKSIETTTVGVSKSDADSFAEKILEGHADADTGDQGRITLVVCNTVGRAIDTHKALHDAGRTDGIELIHSRFRPCERQRWRDEFLNRAACEDKSADRIIVATQVVEAGVDISASFLVTELAPWPSLVQRFGRCARYGGNGRVLVVNRGTDDKSALPYAAEELDSAWNALQHITDVGITALEQYESSLDAVARGALYPFEPSHLLLRREFDELFDTTPDLTGADMDISRFIRSGDERDLQVFWRELGKDQSLGKHDQPRREELCPVPFLKAQDWLCGKETKSKRKPKLRPGMRAWTWDWLDGEWKRVTREALLPGRIVCVAAECGGYTVMRGFSPESKVDVPPVPIAEPGNEAADQADAEHDSDALSVWHKWKTIACHSVEVASEVQEIAAKVGLPNTLIDLMQLAARWHDVGKAHPAFQGCLRDGGEHKRLDRYDLAKAPEACWSKKNRFKYLDSTDHRPGFRHELASALALFAVLERYKPDHPALLGPWSAVLQPTGASSPDVSAGPAGTPTALEQAVLDLDAQQFDLLAYLVATHHGKVRVALHASPKDQDYVDRDGRGLPIRGVREGDTIPPICFDENESPLPELPLTLEPAKLGLSPRTGASWRERTLGLLDRYGPAALAYLEALLRAADVRASRLNTPDPALQPEVVT